MTKKIIGVVAALSLAVTACGPAPMTGDPMVDGAVAQSGSFIQDHPVATAVAVGAAGYYMGKRNERRSYRYNDGYGYRYSRPRTRVIERTIVRRSPSVFSSPSRSYRTVTRSVSYRRR